MLRFWANASPSRRRTAAALAFWPLVAACEHGAIPAGWPHQVGEAVVSTRGMVVTTDELASQVGVEVLRGGGNAVDAAVAIQFALAVVNPEAGNIGGGGFMIVRFADGTAAALDFRERAPLAATGDMYLDSAGDMTDRSLVGHLASGVPGSVAGMWAAHERFGSLPWADLLAPAIALAEGFEVRQRFVDNYDEDVVAMLSSFSGSAAQFLPRSGQPPMLGDTMRQPDLAATLGRVRDSGAEGFYSGETAELVVAEMTRGGGIITREDLAEYEAAWREPIAFPYRGHTLLTMPPSSSGGATMAEMALILERYDLAALGWHSAESIHLFAEAWRRAYADRNEVLADPDF
ncbi:MAG: gamma-glutamyltransferase, partial [Longimicrobiales bacterium]